MVQHFKKPIVSSRLSKSLSSFMGGQLIVELLIAFGLSSILIPAIILGFISGSNGKVQQEQRLKATGYLREAEEAVRSVRDIDWSNIATNGNYYPVVSGGAWSLSSDSNNGRLGDFTRTVNISDTNPPDPSKKQININVSWSNILPSHVTSTIILTRWKNISYSPIAAGGQLTGQGYGDWCNPSAQIVGTPFSLGSIPIAISATTTSTQDFAYTSTGENRSSGTPVFGLTISHASPPVVANPFSSPDNAKAYGMYADGTYVYFTEANPGPTVRIAHGNDLSDAGFFNAAKNGAGAVTVAGVGGTLGAIGYVSIGNSLYSFDLAQIHGSSSQTQLDTTTLAGNGKRLVVAGSNLYITTDSTTAQLEIIPLLPGGLFDKTNVKNINLGNSQSGVDLALDPQGKYLYVVTNFASGQNDFFIIDLTNNNSVTGFSTHIDAGQNGAGDMNPRAVIAVTLDKVIVVGCNGDNGNDKCPVQSTGWNYQVFNVPDSGPSGTTRCGGMTPIVNGLQIPSINAAAGVSQANGNAFSYIIDGVNSSASLQIISGGPGGGGGGNGGTFESQIFDCRNVTGPCITPVIYNRFSEVPSPSPAGVTTNYQVAVSSNCTTFNYTGSYDSNGGAIPFSINPGYCFRYKVTFSNAGGATSASTNVKVNYSP